MIVSKILLLICFYVHLKETHSIMEPGTEYYWPDFVKNYTGFYDDLKETNIERFKIYEKNVEYVKSWNEAYDQGKHRFRLGVNIMSAMTPEERKAFQNDVVKPFTFMEEKDLKDMEKYIGPGYERIEKLYREFQKIQSARNEHTPSPNQAIETFNPNNTKSMDTKKHLDWREHGVVSPVKYQDSCAACYAFSAVDALESNYAIKTGKLLKLSPQMVIDCSRAHHGNMMGNNGCEGGWIHATYDWLKYKGGIALEKDYPYTGREGRCRENVSQALHVLDYIKIPKGDIDMLKATVESLGPVAVRINSNPTSFELYNGDGIYGEDNENLYGKEKCDEDNLSHTGLVVGYGTEGDTDYWIVKNSWGTQWGENGYMKIKMDGNVCGVASLAYFPIIQPPSGGWPHPKVVEV